MVANKKIKLKEALLNAMLLLLELRDILDINEEFKIVMNDKASLDKALTSVSDRFGTGRVFSFGN